LGKEYQKRIPFFGVFGERERERERERETKEFLRVLKPYPALER